MELNQGELDILEVLSALVYECAEVVERDEDS
jgi:hypothetical protein